MPNIKPDAAVAKLMSELAKGEKSIRDNGLLSEEEADKIIASETLMQELAKRKNLLKSMVGLRRKMLKKNLVLYDFSGTHRLRSVLFNYQLSTVNCTL